ncbi:hypothetical protein NDU88_000233 [Pleurodeles waltl]|uniref:Uncharacterized protein n=1 Tax=Pleurodeles waltl TaxID=8319 RepID=A0AAV7USI9_PLEWA|nr:hypothetical protein NDU88_000233 [Pleurodeles waltl]
MTRPQRGEVPTKQTRVGTGVGERRRKKRPKTLGQSGAGRAGPVVIRGQAHALIGGKKKERTLQIEALEKEVRVLEVQLPGDSSEELCLQLLVKQAELHDLAEEGDQEICPGDSEKAI